MNATTYKVEDGGGRIDAWLAEADPELSRSRIRKLIEEGNVSVGEKTITKPSQKVWPGDEVRVVVPPPVEAVAEPEELELDVLHEDGYLIAVAKPKGMVVHPAPGHSGGTLVNALLHHVGDLSGVGGVLRPGIVHRLDKDTSGVIVAAKDDKTHRGLQRLFKSREVDKTYLALVLGKVSEEGVIDSPIGRNPTDRKKMAAGVPGGREARTRFRPIAVLAGATLLEVKIETGRTHQIRVHLAALGHPVAGDHVYGGHKRAKGIVDAKAKKVLYRLDSQALHAFRLGFDHPVTGERLELVAPIPFYLTDTVRKLGGTSALLEALAADTIPPAMEDASPGGA